jgi:hypothetical protein
MDTNVLEKHPASIFRITVWRVWMQLGYIHRLQESLDPWDGEGERTQFRSKGSKKCNMASHIMYKPEGRRFDS